MAGGVVSGFTPVTYPARVSSECDQYDLQQDQELTKVLGQVQQQLGPPGCNAPTVVLDKWLCTNCITQLLQAIMQLLLCSSYYVLNCCIHVMYYTSIANSDCCTGWVHMRLLHVFSSAKQMFLYSKYIVLVWSCSNRWFTCVQCIIACVMCMIKDHKLVHVIFTYSTQVYV